MDTRLRDPRTYAIIGAAMKVHANLGPGYLERVYQEAMCIELERRNVPTKREVEIPIWYDGVLLKCSYRADFVCFDDVLVELKAQSATGQIEDAQVLHYLKAADLGLGLLINFGAESLEFRRLASAWHRSLSVQSVQSVVRPGP